MPTCLTSNQTGAERNDQLNAGRRHSPGGRERRTPTYAPPRAFVSRYWTRCGVYYTGSITLLRPQTGQHVELGFSTALGPTTLEANAFRILLTDEIGFNNATFAE